jgi:arylsulfatase
MVLDDLGFSDIGPFGAEIDTPVLDCLARRGLRLTNYHTTPVCSPARAAILTGLNPHRAGFATVANSDPGFPGLTLELADDVLTLPEILRDAGYATFGIGKWHLTRDALMHDGASRASWPIQRGFDRYYGTLEACNNFFAPNRLLRDNSHIRTDRYPDDYYLTDDLTDEAITMLHDLRAHDGTKPFFLYFAHYAMHAPLAAKAADIDKYRGRYDMGWDILREQRFARQLDQGLFAPGTRLAPPNTEPGLNVPPWQSLPADQRALMARYMEVYAAMVDNVDQNLGRLLAAIDRFGELDNTIIVFLSDNGGAADGGITGSRSYYSNFSKFLQPAAFPADWEHDAATDPELIGGPRSAVQYPRGWAMASNTPFRLYKGTTFAGGVRVPLLLSWPAGLARHTDDDGLRTAYQYVTDLTPTLLDLAGIVTPPQRHGKAAKSRDGVSFAGSLRDRTHHEVHREQYAEFGGQRGYYRDGWKLVTLHQSGADYADSEWELYDVRSDPTELDNLAERHPDVVKELADAWERAAWSNTVFPLADGSGALQLWRRPDEDRLSDPVTIFPGTPTLERYRSSRLIALRDFEVDVDLEWTVGDAGVLVAHGDQGGGYVLYIENDRLHFVYNEYGPLHEVSGGRLAAGRHLIRIQARAIPNFRWTLVLSLNETEVGRIGSVRMLLGMAPFAGIDIGIDRGGPVSWSLHERHGSFPYTGQLHSVSYRPGERADYDPAVLLQATRAATRVYE